MDTDRRVSFIYAVQMMCHYWKRIRGSKEVSLLLRSERGRK